MDMLFQVREQASKIVILRVRVIYVSHEKTKDKRWPVYIRAWHELTMIDSYIDKSKWLFDEEEEMIPVKRTEILDDDISESDFVRKVWKHRDEVPLPKHAPKYVPTTVWHKYLDDERNQNEQE